MDTRTWIATAAGFVGIATGLSVDTIRSFPKTVAAVDAIEVELHHQSVTDSALVYRTWLMLVGLQYVICVDSVAATGEPTVRNGCRHIARYAPELFNPVIPPPPAMPVWRSESQKGKAK